MLEGLNWRRRWVEGLSSILYHAQWKTTGSFHPLMQAILIISYHSIAWMMDSSGLQREILDVLLLSHDIDIAHLHRIVSALFYESDQDFWHSSIFFDTKNCVSVTLMGLDRICECSIQEIYILFSLANSFSGFQLLKPSFRYSNVICIVFVSQCSVLKDLKFRVGVWNLRNPFSDVYSGLAKCFAGSTYIVVRPLTLWHIIWCLSTTLQCFWTYKIAYVSAELRRFPQSHASTSEVFQQSYTHLE